MLYISEYLEFLVVAHFMWIFSSLFMLLREKKDCFPLALLKVFLRIQCETLFFPHDSDSYILLIENVVKYLLVLFFPPPVAAMGVSTLTLISFQRCPVLRLLISTELSV